MALFAGWHVAAGMLSLDSCLTFCGNTAYFAQAIGELRSRGSLSLEWHTTTIILFASSAPDWTPGLPGNVRLHASMPQPAAPTPHASPCVRLAGLARPAVFSWRRLAWFCQVRETLTQIRCGGDALMRQIYGLQTLYHLPHASWLSQHHGAQDGSSMMPMLLYKPRNLLLLNVWQAHGDVARLCDVSHPR